MFQIQYCTLKKGYLYIIYQQKCCFYDPRQLTALFLQGRAMCCMKYLLCINLATILLSLIYSIPYASVINFSAQRYLFMVESPAPVTLMVSV